MQYEWVHRGRIEFVLGVDARYAVDCREVGRNRRRRVCSKNDTSAQAWLYAAIAKSVHQISREDQFFNDTINYRNNTS